MSILIKGMEMTKNCDKCKFFAWKLGVGQYCAVDDRITFHATINGMDVGYERNGNCPLIEIVHCKDCRWGKEVCGNIECWTDINVPPEYHGYEWFCSNGERQSE